MTGLLLEVELARRGRRYHGRDRIFPSASEPETKEREQAREREAHHKNTASRVQATALSRSLNSDEPTSRRTWVVHPRLAPTARAGAGYAPGMDCGDTCCAEGAAPDYYHHESVRGCTDRGSCWGTGCCRGRMRTGAGSRLGRIRAGGCVSSRSGGRGTEEGGTGEGTVLAGASTGMGSAAEAGRTCRACRVRGAMRRRVQSMAEAEVGRSREDSRSARGRKAGEGARRSGTGRIGVDASMECRSDSVVAALFGVGSMGEG